MTETTPPPSADYRNFIKEAYIDPIRTVLIVDDEFPSLDGIIRQAKNEVSQDSTETGQWDPKDISRVKELLGICREPDRHWLVDVHDARTIPLENEMKFAPYLHQSDLMILDYHLEGTEKDGTKAIELLRLLAINEHFNLVIVYTKGYAETGGDITKVFNEIVVGLMAPDSALTLDRKLTNQVITQLQEWEDHDPEIKNRLLNSVGIDAYLAARGPGKPNFKLLKDQPEFLTASAVIGQKPEDVEINEILLLQWLISEKQETLKDKLFNKGTNAIDFKQKDNGTNWVRTDRLFVTLVSKTLEPQKLPERLLDTLCEWQPHPHRLIMSRMRAELNKYGMTAEEKVMDNQYLEAGWLKTMLAHNEEDKQWRIRSTIDNHWDSLGNVLIENIQEFASRLADHLSKRDSAELVKTFHLINPESERIEIAKQINSFNCSKLVEGYHLCTGHVLETAKDGGKNYFLCLTPACDLVPGQKDATGWHKHLGGHMPFKAVRLYPTDDEGGALSVATRNNHLFLKIDEAIKIFSFTPNQETTSNPSWEEMFCVNQGKLSSPDFKTSIGRVVFRDNNLRIDYADFRVVSQLRYEYALNLLQRLGGTLSRVGLDFQSVTADKKS
jgi:hypothetical protein